MTMNIVYQTNKKTGITYAYENQAYWDKQKKQSRAKRKLIGKLDPATGEIVPTRHYKKSSDAPIQGSSSSCSVDVRTCKRHFFGATHLLDQIGKELGITKDLKDCFPADYEKILSVAYYLILEENNSLSRFPHWHQLHTHPYGSDINSQRSSELFQSISEDAKINFFQKQGRRRAEKEYWAFDTTSISSYSETLSQVKKGKNKEHDRLPQINLALLFGEASGLPFYYRKLPGNITDVKTIKQLMQEFRVLGYQKVKLVLDRGFYSKTNIDLLYQNHQKFIIGTKLNLEYVSQVLKAERANLKRWSNLEPQFRVNGICKAIQWEYQQKRPNKGDVLNEKRRAYLMLFYNGEKAAKDATDRNDYYTKLHDDLINNTRKEYRHKDYAKYFTVSETPKRGKVITPNEEAMEKAGENDGYFALLSNEIKDPFEALSIYRSKDIVEKGFADLKGRLSFRKTQVSSELSLNGKMFVEFVALIYLSYIKKKMQEAKLFSKWTLQGLLDELDLIERFEGQNGEKFVGEMTEKQRNLYECLGIKPPSL